MDAVTGFATALEQAGLPAGVIAFLMAFLLFVVVLMVAVYVYMALALTSIAKRTGTEPAWLSWIPVAHLYLMSKIAKMHWWPMLLLIGFLIPFINFFFMIAFAVFMFIWLWKIFEAVGRPGWWSLLGLIPFVGGLVVLIMLGVAAWGQPPGAAPASQS